MYETLVEKLELVKELKSITEDMVKANASYEDELILNLIVKRKKIIDRIDELDNLMSRYDGKRVVGNDTKKIKREIGDIIGQIIELDKIVRKSVNTELDRLRPIVRRPSLNVQNDFRTKINIKA